MFAFGTLLAAPAVSGAGATLVAKLSGSHEVPAVATDGWGTARVVIRDDESSVFYQVTYGGLSGAVVAAHIHVGAIGSNGPIILPLAVGPSPMSGTLTQAQFTGANGLTWTQALAAIRAGGTYVNLHTAAHPGGEIRGQIYDGAATQSYAISADAPEAVPAGHLWAFNDYFPRTLTVAKGSVISFVIKGFHTGTLLPSGMTVAQDFASGGSVAVDDKDDTGLNANGTTKAEFNIPALLPVKPTQACGTPADPCSFDGTAIVSEGAPLGPPSDPTAFRIDAPTGSYWFHCRVHPAMVGKITVVTQGSSDAASPDDAAATAAADVASDVASATALETAKSKPTWRINADGTKTTIIDVGAETRDHHVNLLEMLPAKVHVTFGDHIVYRISGHNEPHTVTFPKDLNTDQIPACEGSNGADVPCAGPPDEIEFGSGNGVHVLKSPSTISDSGLIATAAGLHDLGVKPSAAVHTWKVDIYGTAKTGTYTYVCQIHDGMAGSIVVGLELPDRDPNF